jgi:TRAP-type C4-dicarboxylate transport system substrate-binding protein
VPWPPQGIYSQEAAELAADLKGVKWRAYSPATARIAELVGAQPVTVQAAELSQALATGVVESYMSSGSTGWDSKTYEHLKYWYDTQAWLPKNAGAGQQGRLHALDKATQDAVLKAGADAEARGLAASKKANGETLDKLKGAGMQILPPSAQLKADMKKVGDTMLKEWLDKAGPEGKQLVDAFRSKAPPCASCWTRCTTARRAGRAVHGRACWAWCCCPSSAGSCTSTCPAPTPTPAT